MRWGCCAARQHLRSKDERSDEPGDEVDERLATLGVVDERGLRLAPGADVPLEVVHRVPVRVAPLFALLDDPIGGLQEPTCSHTRWSASTRARGPTMRSGAQFLPMISWFE